MGLDCQYYNGEYRAKTKWNFMFKDTLYKCFGYHELSHQFIVEDEKGKLGFVSISEMEDIKPISDTATLIYLLNKVKEKFGEENDKPNI